MVTNLVSAGDYVQATATAFVASLAPQSLAAWPVFTCRHCMHLLHAGPALQGILVPAVVAVAVVLCPAGMLSPTGMAPAAGWSLEGAAVPVAGVAAASPACVGQARREIDNVPRNLLHKVPLPACAALTSCGQRRSKLTQAWAGGRHAHRCSGYRPVCCCCPCTASPQCSYLGGLFMFMLPVMMHSSCTSSCTCRQPARQGAGKRRRPPGRVESG